MDISNLKLELQLPGSDDPSRSQLLQQTKQVYDQLLMDRYCRLSQALLERKSQYDSQCGELQNSQRKQEAMEFCVRAQQALNSLQEEMAEELGELRKDYQTKLNNMQQQLELSAGGGSNNGK